MHHVITCRSTDIIMSAQLCKAHDTLGHLLVERDLFDRRKLRYTGERRTAIETLLAEFEEHILAGTYPDDIARRVLAVM